MNVQAMLALYSRRASVVGWAHAKAAAPNTVDPLTQGPRASLGGPPLTTGPFGETYHDYVNIRAYWTGKVSSTNQAQYGVVEAGDAEICCIVPFTAEPDAGVWDLPADLEIAYNTGLFATIAQSKTLATFDRFNIYGKLWVAKDVPVPIVDLDTVVAWRTLVTKLTT